MLLENQNFDTNIHCAYAHGELFYKVFIIVETEDSTYIDRGIACITVKRDLSDLQRCIDDCIDSIQASIERRGLRRTARFIGFQLK